MLHIYGYEYMKWISQVVCSWGWALKLAS